MQKITLWALLLIGAIACKPKPEPPSATNTSLVIGNPVNYGLDNVLLFPVGANYNPAITKNESLSTTSGNNLSTSEKGAFSQNYSDSKFDRNAKDEYINSNENDFDIRNILFYDKKTGQSRPLFKDTLHILSFAIHREFASPLIFFRIVKRDINEDKIYNSKDAVMLYVSKLDGTDFTQITPDNEQFFDYFYYEDTETILIKTAIDIDKSKSFTTLDETNFREMKLNAPAMGREIFTQSLKDSLKNQLGVFQ